MAILVAPFVALPELTWWVIPLELIVYSLARPVSSVWEWPNLAAAIWWPTLSMKKGRLSHRQAHVATAAENDDVQRGGRHGPGVDRLLHAIPPM